MPMKSLLAIGVVAALCVAHYGSKLPAAGGQSPVRGPTAPRPQWEYKALTRGQIEQLAPPGSKERLTDGLNTLGSSSWELVAVAPPIESGGNPKLTTLSAYLFKRSK